MKRLSYPTESLDKLAEELHKSNEGLDLGNRLWYWPVTETLDLVFVNTHAVCTYIKPKEGSGRLIKGALLEFAVKLALAQTIEDLAE